MAFSDFQKRLLGLLTRFHLTADNPTRGDAQQRLHIRRAAKVIELSPCDANALEKHRLKPKAITPHMTVYSATKKEKHRFPNQVCDGCAPGLFKHYGYGVADTGWCSQCYQVGECLDVPLIEHYRKQGIDDDIIYAHLPRLRWNAIHQPEFNQTLEEIESTYQAIFDLAKSTSMPNQQN